MIGAHPPTCKHNAILGDCNVCAVENPSTRPPEDTEYIDGVVKPSQYFAFFRSPEWMWVAKGFMQHQETGESYSFDRKRDLWVRQSLGIKEIRKETERLTREAAERRRQRSE